MNDPKSIDPVQKIPSYYNPHNVEQTPNLNSFPLLQEEDKEPDPQILLKQKYPIKILAGVALLIITLLAIPVGVYLNQRPTKVFIEATATPTPTPTPASHDEATESAKPNESPVPY